MVGSGASVMGRAAALGVGVQRVKILVNITNYLQTAKTRYGALTQNCVYSKFKFLLNPINVTNGMRQPCVWVIDLCQASKYSCRVTLFETAVSRHSPRHTAQTLPRNRRSKSPQVKQPFSEYKPKRLGTYSRSFSDNVPEYDNVSLKALFEQEDMRGEPVSNRKKIFERLSSFPKRKFRALRTNSGGSVSRRTPFVRSKSENVASVLIRSIMDPNAFLLARVPETEEISDSNKSFDSESIVHPLRYDDGHLVPISSSSSDISSSDIEDISDDISSNSTSTQDYSLLESDKGKHSKLNTSTSVDNSITSRNEDDLAERINTSTSFDNSITSKVDEGLVEKEDDSLNILKPNVFTSSVHVVITGDSDVEDNNQTQYSSFVKFKDSPSPPVKVRSIISNLKRQESFDTTFGIRKRSDTPPLSEMDPYMKFKPVEELNYSIGTLHKAKSAASLTVTQPSLDEDLKSRPVTNLSFPESVRNLPSVRIGHIPSCSYKTVHTVDFSGRNDSVRLSMGSAPSLCPEADKQDLKSTDPTLFKITTERNEINDILLNEKNKQPISFIPEHNINKSEVILKTENNPFEFPCKISSSKIKLIDKLSEYFETKLTTYRDDTLSTVQSANESIFNEITSSEQGEDFKKEEEKLDCFNSLLQNQTKDHSKTTSSESELSVNEVSNCEDITVIENSIEENINTLVEDFETIQLLKDKKDIVEENSEDSKNKKSDVWKNVDNDCKTDKMSAYKSEVKQNANEDSTSVVSRDSLLSTENGSLHETSKEFSQIVTVKENSPSHYIESLSVAGVKDKEKIGDLNHNNKVTNDKTLSNESEEIDKITSNAGDNKSLFIFGQKSSHVEELQECSEKDTVNEAVVPELTEERVTCAVSTSLDDNAPTVESPVDNDSTNQVCDTVTSNLSIPHLPLVKSLSASGLVEPCHSSVPPSRTVPEETAAGLPPASVKVSQSPVKLSTTPGIHRRSSDSDLSITPKGMYMFCVLS
ncbi:hypothetical protein J6590_100177 [Homalodisca vitripennis]|nr:hypothetical protein J6590_100177 [Homalodisca vitripennis]